MKEWNDISSGLPEELRAKSASEVMRIHGGRNNQVFLYDCIDGTKRVLKSYNPAAVGNATRLQREFSFLNLLWEGGIRDVPEPVYRNEQLNLGVYGYIEGERLATNWTRPWAVDAASRFLVACQELRPTAPAAAVPAASEACFSLEAHAAVLERRLVRLEDIQSGDGIHAEAKGFLEKELTPGIERAVAALRASPDSGLELRADERWLSPSDFGFHNALRTGTRSLAFLDFEHAGWDDPAKLIVDFCHQPDHPLPAELAKEFENAMIATEADPDVLRRRVQRLRPVYQLKWACILLNEFLPFGTERREFLGLTKECEATAEKERQLKRARCMVNDALTDMNAVFN